MMSHSSSSSVVQNNTTVIINVTNKALASGKLSGINPIPNGTGANQVEQNLATAMSKTLASYWAIAFPTTPFDAGNLDFAFFEAPPVLNVNMPVPNAITAIDADLKQWNIPVTDSSFAENIVHRALLNIILQGGVIATSHGSQFVGPAQTTDWAVVTITAKAPGKDGANLIGYAFSAVNA